MQLSSQRIPLTKALVGNYFIHVRDVKASMDETTFNIPYPVILCYDGSVPDRKIVQTTLVNSIKTAKDYSILHDRLWLLG